MIGEIHITAFASILIDELKANKFPEDYVVFEKEDFKIDDAKEVIAQSYLATPREKLIIMNANKYNIAAQNALLKITEEPPQNVKFILIAKNKNAFLPTILSRLRLIYHPHRSEIAPFVLNVAKLNLGDIYAFCKENDKNIHTKEEIKLRIQSLLHALYNAKIPLDSKELALFDNAIKLNQNDATERENYIFLPILLRILNKQRTKK